MVFIIDDKRLNPVPISRSPSPRSKVSFVGDIFEMPCVKLCCPTQMKIVEISISAMTVPQVGGKSEQKGQCLSPSGLDTKLFFPRQSWIVNSKQLSM